jgi:amino acid adenylation domain-containing protein
MSYSIPQENTELEIKKILKNTDNSKSLPMNKKNGFSCFVIGEGTLPRKCAEILLEKGHKIKGIISPDRAIREWTEEKNIVYLKSIKKLKKVLAEEKCDYLFSIVNQSIIPEEIFALAQKGAINYHDAPLPKYAGVNATSWALINQEQKHGITWHVISEEVNAGEILKQVMIEIAPAETTLTLTSKCYQAAIAAFDELVDELASQTVKASKQNLQQRSYFPRSKKPKAAGIIDFHSSAEEIDALVRGLDFGSYANPLGSAKLALHKDFVIITSLEILQQKSSQSPGTIIAIAEDKLQIATSSQDIALKQVKTKQGQLLSIAELVSCYQLEVGKQLPQIDKTLTEKIEKVDSAIASSESFWVKQLSHQQPLIIPYVQRKLSSSSQAKYAQIEIPISQKVISFLDKSNFDWQLGDFLLAAFSIYLARLNSSKEITLGLNQLSWQSDWQDFENWFAPDVPLSLTIEYEENFTTVCEQIQKQLKLTQQRQTYSTEIFARYPQLTATETGEPLFSAKVTWQDHLNTNHYQFLSGNSYLTLVINNQQQKYFWLYNTEAFNQETITRMLGQLTTLIKGIVSDCHCPIAQLPLLSPEEKHQLLVEWNNTQTDYPQDKCFHQLFAEKVEENPEAIAVVYENQQLTYQQLNQRANQLANYLQKLGVKPETLVGICVERSLEMVIGLLGILKAGGAYVPLDPNYPQERLTYMLDDSKLSILLTQEKLLEQLPVNSAAITCLDRDWDIIAQNNQENPVSSVTTSNLAYVIYTSGSTGKPKGVLATHQGLPNLALDQAKVFGVKADSCVLQFASFSFDASISEIAMALVSGARLCLAKKESLLPGLPLIRLFQEQGITHITIAPSALAILPDEPIPSLEGIIVAGEACPAELVAKWSKNRHFFNAYGPTETTVCATIAECKDGTQKPSIGRPIANTQIYILDSHLQPVPVRVAGEIYIGSIGIARGYLNRPELTAERFIPNPFINEFPLDIKSLLPSLYRTGDLGKWLPNGEIEYLGRIDHQVKIRGFRIELEEIEAIVTKHPDVLQTVAMVREDIPGDKRIVAYVVAKPESNVSGTILRQFLQEKLPEYMLPNAIVMLDSVPVTPNGKVDKKALPAPNRSDLSQNSVAPRTATEKTLATIWSEVLGVERVGVYDNFFELGGHSLLAIQILSRVREAFGVELSLTNLFNATILADLSSLIDSDRQSVINNLSIAKVYSEGNLPLSFAQQRLWFLEQLEGKSAAYNIPRALRLLGNLDVSALQQAIVQVVERHEALRTNVAVIDGTPIQVVKPALNISLPLVDLQELSTEQQETEVAKLINEEAHKLFDLGKDSLIRVSLLCLAEQSYVLLVTMHHIISDGWSLKIFFRELSSFYAGLISGNPCQLEELPIQYADFANWQRQWLQGEVLEKQLSYWQEHLDNAPPVLNLPLDRPRPAIQTFRGARETCWLSKTLSDRLKTLSQQENVTLFMTLLTAFKILLYRHSGQDDIVVGTPIAGRNRAELESLIGFFINTVVLRTRLGGNPSFHSLLNQVREVALGAYAHQDFPFEKLVEELKPERDLSYTPMFQVWFNMLNLGEVNLQLPGLNVEEIAIPEAASKFDLTLYAQESPEGIKLEWVYNQDLFAATTIERMIAHFQILLEGIVSDPEKSITNFSLLNDRERQNLRQQNNLVRPLQTFTEFLREDIFQAIAQRFEQQVQKYPENIAVETKNYQWTYKTLNSKANAIARTILQLCGNNPERIALLFEHDAPMIAGIFAVLKAGKAYVALDPTYPQTRLAYVVENSEATAILTNKQNYSLAKELSSGKIPLINLDEIELAEDTDNLNLPIAPDSLAYILYTSGSTGQPKGVIQNQRNVLHFIRNYSNNLHISPNDKLTLVASYSFDAAVIDIFGALLNGATLCPIDVKKEGLVNLSEWLREKEITIYHSTPTLYRHFLETLPSNSDSTSLFPKIRLVVLGGEEVVRRDVKLYQQYFSQDCLFVNGLGCSESSFHLQYLIDKQTVITQNSVPVGYLYEETELLLLNEAGDNAEIYGEIAIRSPYLALGYWQKPELTSKVFLADPEGKNRRIYRTGDLGYLRADGNLEYRGRKDFQVKIRGFRIELGEVENAILKHPQVQETVVIAKEDGVGNKILVAYVVSPETSTNNLRDFLREKLPEYMIPATFVWLDAIPLTPNGKINRLALPAPDFSKLDSTSNFIAPRNDTERQLREIWEKVLKIQPISVKDNFFDLGGHSMVALQLFAQIQEQFQRDLPLTTLFQAPTIEQLACIIKEENDSSPQWSNLVAIQPNGDKKPFFFVHGAAGGLLQFQKLAQYIGNDQPFYGLEAIGMDGKEPIPDTVEEMASHYLQEIRAFQPEGPYLLGGLCFGGKVAFEMAQRLQAQGQEVALLILFNTMAPGALQRLPLLQRLSSHLLNLVQKGPGFAIAKTQGKITWFKNRQRKNRQKQKMKATVEFAHVSGRDLSFQERHLPVAEAHKRANQKYIPQVYSGKVTLFQTEGDLTPPEGYSKDPQWGWVKFAGGGLEIHVVPGRHNAVLTDANIPIQAKTLRDCLDKVQGNRE